jgi:hypothetical protein
MVLFNSPVPFDKEAMAGMNTRAAPEAGDYFRRQGTDADGLAGELATPEQRRRYIATFYTSRFWAHPGKFSAEDVDFMTEPFGNGPKLRASFGGYESAFHERARSEPTMVTTLKRNPTWTLILFGQSDHVLYPDFDRMAAVVFPNHVGPYLLRDCGHFVQWEAAAVLNNTLVSFCGDLLAGVVEEEEVGSRPGPLSEDEARRVFVEEMFDGIKRLSKQYHYHPSRFIQVVNDMGPVAAAHHFATDPEVHEGLWKLVELGAVEESVEHMVLDPRFRTLFEDEVRQAARAKLVSLGAVVRWEE